MNQDSTSHVLLPPVPMLDLRRQYAGLREEILSALERVCSQQHFILGEEVTGFEQEAAQFLGAQRVVGCASGTDALWLALVAAGVGPGDAVVTTPFSFFATVSAIIRAGARPVLADIDADTLNLDPGQVAQALQGAGNIRAVLPVHLYGQCVDMAAFTRLAREHGLKIIEDAAQAFGAAWNDCRAGTLGDAAAFSFYPTKNLSAYGDAGCVTTNDNGIADRIAMLRDHGSRQRYRHEETGANSRLGAMQAAVLRIKLKYLSGWNQARRERAATYEALLGASGLLPPIAGSSLSPQTPVQRLTTRSEAFHIFHQYVLRVHRRDKLHAFSPAAASPQQSIIRFRFTCNPVLLIWVTAKAICPSPSRPRARCWPCLCFPS